MTRALTTLLFTTLMLFHYATDAQAPPVPVAPLAHQTTLTPSPDRLAFLDNPYRDYILYAAACYEVHPRLIDAVIQAESAYKPRAVSSKGARGLMQLMPHTARRLGVSNAFDPFENIMGGTRYLRELLDVFKGNVTLSLAAYNAGEDAVIRYRGIPPYAETWRYLGTIRYILTE